MSERYIKLADGTIYENGECGYADGILWCYLPVGTDMKTAFADFSEPTKTEHIVFHYGVMESEYDGFTDIRLCMIGYDGDVRVQLFKGAE